MQTYSEAQIRQAAAGLIDVALVDAFVRRLKYPVSDKSTLERDAGRRRYKSTGNDLPWRSLTPGQQGHWIRSAADAAVVTLAEDW